MALLVGCVGLIESSAPSSGSIRFCRAVAVGVPASDAGDSYFSDSLFIRMTADEQRFVARDCTVIPYVPRPHVPGCAEPPRSFLDFLRGR
jgi:hypothetical protein